MILRRRSQIYPDDKVSRIAKVIHQIAFQSNLLALSAAVEAGPDLAQQSTQSAKDTAAMIKKSIDESE